MTTVGREEEQSFHEDVVRRQSLALSIGAGTVTSSRSATLQSALFVARICGPVYSGVRSVWALESAGELQCSTIVFAVARTAFARRPTALVNALRGLDVRTPAASGAGAPPPFEGLFLLTSLALQDEPGVNPEADEQGPTLRHRRSRG
jgi:hypothetical protein